MKKLGLLLVFSASLSFTQQSAAPVQLTQVPPKPTCTPLLPNGSCANLWRNYNQALQQRTREELQLYISNQKEQAKAPLQQLVNDLEAQISKLQGQMQADSVAALQEKSAAYSEGLEYGTGIGVGASLLGFGLIFVIRRFTSKYTVTKKPQAKAASA